MVAPFVASAQDLPDLGGRVVTIAVENAYIPFNYIDEASGEAVGFDYDVMNEICERINCTPEYVQTTWDALLVGVAAGEFDVGASGITITEEREQTVDFSMGVIATGQVLLTRLGEDRFASVADFTAGDFFLGTQRGTTNYDKGIELVGEARVVAFDEFGPAIQALVNGDVDAVIIDSTAGQGYTGENAELLTIINEPLTSDFLGYAFVEGSDLVEPFDAALMSMVDDGTLAVISATWFPPALPDLGGRVVTIAVENAYIPFNFIDEASGEAVGFDYDVMNEICARINCTPEYVQTTWDALLVGVAAGEFDVGASGITITEEREQTVDFSMGVIATGQVLLTRLSEDRFASVADFTAGDFFLGTQRGTTNYDKGIELVGEARVVAFDEFGPAIQALVNGDVDAVIIDSTAGQGYTGENAELLTIINEPLTSDFLGYAFVEGSDLVEPFDAALVSMMADGTLETISTTWFPPVGQ
jgi:polar amino acid transport system substrate-binding protein